MKSLITVLACLFTFPFHTFSQIDDYYTDLGYFKKTEKSVVLFDEGKYADAIYTINQAIDEGKDPAMAYALKGYMFMLLGKEKEGLQNLKKSLKIAPAYLFPADVLAWYYSERKEFDKAIKITTKTIEAYPLEKRAFLIRALVKLKMSYADINDDGGAQVDFDYALQLSRDTSICYLEIGLLYHRIREYRKALEYYDQAIHYDSAQALAYYKKGIIYLKLPEGKVSGKYCAEFKKAMELGLDEGALLHSQYCRN